MLQDREDEGRVPLVERDASDARRVEKSPQERGGDLTHQSTWHQRVGSAGFYCVASMLITLSNKVVLTSFGFPAAELLGLCQLAATASLLAVGRLLGLVRVPALSGAVLADAWPLPGLFLANLLFGLAGTKALSLPIFIALRRFTVAMTLAAEIVFLRVVPTASVQISVLVMTIGATVAALNDFNATLAGVAFVMFNNACSAAQGAYYKRCLRHLGPFGVLFYNSILSLPVAMVIVLGTPISGTSIHGWSDWRFTFAFLTSCLMGVALQAGALMCVHHNSALTYAIMGSVKNVSVSYVGMFVGGDYRFTPANFLGINISVVGTLLYLWLTFRK